MSDKHPENSSKLTQLANAVRSGGVTRLLREPDGPKLLRRI